MSFFCEIQNLLDLSYSYFNKKNVCWNNRFESTLIYLVARFSVPNPKLFHTFIRKCDFLAKIVLFFDFFFLFDKCRIYTVFVIKKERQPKYLYRQPCRCVVGNFSFSLLSCEFAQHLICPVFRKEHIFDIKLGMEMRNGATLQANKCNSLFDVCVAWKPWLRTIHPTKRMKEARQKRGKHTKDIDSR